jgi:cytochrome P450
MKTEDVVVAPGVLPTREFVSAEPGRVCGWTQCRDALSKQELVSDPSRAGLASEQTNNLLLTDGKSHQETRRVLASYFTRARLERVADRLESISRECVRSLVDKSDADLVMDLAEPIVLEGILSMMDVPDASRARLAELSRDMLGLLEPDLADAARRRSRNAAMRATLLFERDGASGRATGLHAALEEAARNGRIPAKLARSTPVVVLHGGYENPLNQLGCMIVWAVENPERFRDAAESAPEVLFDEIQRVYSPVRVVARFVASDAAQADRLVKRGDLVWVDLESANLDQGRFPAPHDLDLTGKRSHLGFGHGPHLCPGVALARLEGQALMRALLALPADLFHQFTVKWRDGVVARGPLAVVRRQMCFAQAEY